MEISIVGGDTLMVCAALAAYVSICWFGFRALGALGERGMKQDYRGSWNAARVASHRPLPRPHKPLAPVGPTVTHLVDRAGVIVNGVEMATCDWYTAGRDSDACDHCGYVVCSCNRRLPGVLAGFHVEGHPAIAHGQATFDYESKRIYLSSVEYADPVLRGRALGAVAAHYSAQLELKASAQRIADNSAKSNADKQRVELMAKMAQSAQEAALMRDAQRALSDVNKGYARISPVELMAKMAQSARIPPVRIPAATLSAFAEFVPKNPPPTPELKVSASATADFIWSDKLRAYVPVKGNA